MASAAVDVADRPAVGGGVAAEAVGALRKLVGRVGVGWRGRAVDRVVRGHQAGHMRVLDQAPELGSVVIADVGVGGVGAARVPVVVDVVQRVVLRRGRDLQVAVNGLPVHRLALVAVDECTGHLRRQIGVLAEGLIGTPPARVAVQVDVGRPVGQGAVVAV